MKRIFILLLMIFLISVLTGCSEEYIRITEDESNAIAQYCSHLILKYDKNKTDDMKLLDYNDFEKELEKRQSTEIKPVPEITDEPSPIPDEPIDEDGPEVDIQDPTPTPEASESEAGSDEKPVVNECTLDEAFGLDGFTVEYNRLVVTDSYNTSDSFALYAQDDQKLAIVEFTVKNITNSDKRLDMSEEEIKYCLLDETSKEHSPVLSFLPVDFQYYKEVIKANSEVTTCLVFYIRNDTAPKSLEILGKQTYTINFN